MPVNERLRGQGSATLEGEEQLDGGAAQSSSVLQANRNSAQNQIAQHLGGGAAGDEQVIVLQASTSTTPIGRSMNLFAPDTQYTGVLTSGFFDQLAAPEGLGFLDMLKAGGATRQNELKAGELDLKGNRPVEGLFTLTSMRGADGRRAPTSRLEVTASNNGMLALARLASAYISAIHGGALRGNPARLTIHCHVAMGQDPKAADDESRKESYLTTTPPAFGPTWNGVANLIMSGLLNGYGFGGDIDPTHMDAPIYSQGAAGSLQAKCDLADRFVAGAWKDRPSQRTFVKKPMTGVGALIRQKVAATAPGAFSAEQPGRDVDPMDVRRAAFYGKQPGRDDHLDESIMTKVIAESKDIAERLKNSLVAALADGIASELPPGMEQFAPLMAERWAAAIEAGLRQVRWEYWYQTHFQTNRYGAATAGTSTTVTAVTGSDEGFVHNEIRLHKEPKEE